MTTLSDGQTEIRDVLGRICRKIERNRILARTNLTLGEIILDIELADKQYILDRDQGDTLVTIVVELAFMLNRQAQGRDIVLELKAYQIDGLAKLGVIFRYPTHRLPSKRYKNKKKQLEN